MLEQGNYEQSYDLFISNLNKTNEAKFYIAYINEVYLLDDIYLNTSDSVRTTSSFLYKQGDFGYNAKTENYENMLKAGIIDPTKVTRIALENAASVAGMLLTTECVLADIKEENPTPPMGAPGMGGGMPGMM